MTGQQKSHFDVAALVRAVFYQPLGLRISTNHPHGWRRVVYAHLKRNPSAGRFHILQDPSSANKFLLVREDFQLEQTA